METDHLGLDHPLWLGETVYTRGLDRSRDRKITTRRNQLLKLWRRWSRDAYAAMELSEHHPVYKSWRDFRLNTFYPPRPFQYSAETLLTMEGINDTWNVAGIHAAREQWYAETLGYRTDCTMLLIQLLNNMRFCRETGNHRAMMPGLGFPLLNYEMHVGPMYPLPDSKFGQPDKQIAVNDGGTLWYFEGEDYTSARELKIYKVIR